MSAVPVGRAASLAIPGKLLALVVGALGLAVGVLLISGAPPGQALREFVEGTMGSPGAISATLKETTPLLLAGLAVFVALRAGLFNIGVEGQFLVGAAAAVWVGLSAPGPLGIFLGALTGMAVGAAWALPAALIKAYRGGHEVISTIMLNNIALYVTAALVSGPMKDPTQQSPTTALLSPSTRLPNVVDQPPMTISWALPLGIVLVAAFALWLRKSVAGYELNLVGLNPTAARLAGVRVEGTLVKAMLASGAVAGLAGSLHALAFEGRFYQGFSPGYGFDALGVALLAGASPWGLLPAGLAFGLLSNGSTQLLIGLGIPKGLSGVLLGLLIIVFAAVRYREMRRDG